MHSVYCQVSYSIFFFTFAAILRSLLNTYVLSPAAVVVWSSLCGVSSVDLKLSVRGQKPLTECQQNQRDGCGFVEEAADEVHTPEGQQDRVIRSPHHWESDLVHVHTQTSWLYHLRQLSEGPKHCPFWCCGKANVLGTGKLRTVAWCTAKRPSALHSRLCWTTPELVGLWRILTTTAADYSSFYPQAKASFLSSSGWWTLTSDLCICSALLSCVNLLHCTAHLHFAYKNVHSLIVKFVLHLWHLYNLLFYILKNCTAFLQTGPTYFYSLFIYISFCNADVYSDSIPLYCTLVFLAQPQAYATLHFTTHIAWSMWQIHPLDLECM